MARRNVIVVSTCAKGHYFKGHLKTGITPYPGTAMQIDASAGIDDNGNYTFELYDADADGGRPKGPLLILDMDRERGRKATDQYEDSAFVQCYCPLPGDELNILVQDAAGTGSASDFGKGDMLFPDKGTGEFILSTGSPETEMFMAMEDLVDLTADALCFAIYTGY